MDKEVKVIPINRDLQKNLTQQVLDRKRPDFTKLVPKHTKSF
jgi:hypothetical protein